MDNREFIEILSGRTGFDVEETERSIELLCEVIAETVAEEDCVAVASFGTFEPKKKLEKVALHPSTGKKMLVPPRLTLGFSPSALLKSEVK